MRLNVQLDRYQETLRRSNLNITLSVLEDTNQKSSDSGIFDITRSKELIDEMHKTHKHTPVAWGNVSTHTLGPLLDAYEDTIREKEEIVQNYELELYNFSGITKIWIFNELYVLIKVYFRQNERSIKRKRTVDCQIK